ncbi:hypothetical protein EDB89DRAFT_2076296 [Lactarius sanguifluus]|nr:hypothetical protein EDB89DRAFT_2076296 [Lactarius sanguifluus]
MAQPPGDETRPYDPSETNPTTPLFLTTPSSGPLNNSGTYKAAATGPIVADGHGQPRLREDGQAYWDDSKPTPQPIIIDSSSPIEAGRSPQDSKMNSPESEEPTVPSLAHHEVGPATLLAIQIALDRVPEQPSSSRELWDNVPSLPADLPPQPEVIEVKGRTSDTSRTPRGRSRAGSNASVWSHATVETISSTGDATTERLLPQASNDSDRNLGGRFETALQAIKTGMLPDPFNPDDIPVSQLPPPANVDDEWDNAIDKVKEDLANELTKDVVEQVIGWGAYTLVDNLDLRKAHDLPFDGRTIHAAAAATLLTLDVGGAKEEGETAVAGLTPSSWTRLLLGLLAAAIRGALRSPRYITTSTKSLNWRNDMFPIQAELDRPLTEVGAIVMMCQQLGGLFESNANHSMGRGYPRFPDSYFERLTRTITRCIDRFDREFLRLPSHDPADLPALPLAEPLTEAQRRQADARARETLYQEILETLRLDGVTMAQISASVKDGIFADLNAQALENADEWRAMYKHEFVETMHAAFEAQYPGIHPVKGKARTNPPITTSQVVRDAQPRIRAEVQAQVNARIRNIHEEIQESLAAEEPFWKEGPLRDAIATTIRTAAQAEADSLTAQEVEAMKKQATDEIARMRQQLDHTLNQEVELIKTAKKAKLEVERQLLQEATRREVAAYKAGVELDLKAWKVHHRNIRDLSGVKRSAERLGYKLTPNGPPSRECVNLTAPINVLEVFGAQVASTTSSRAPSPAPSPITPPNHPHSLPDSNVTPTPVRIKRIRTEDMGPASPLQPYPDEDTVIRTNPEFYTRNLAHTVAAPLPPPTPMEEDLDYALEVKADAAVANNGGLQESIHAPLAHPTPIPAHNPTDPVQAPPAAANDGLAALIAGLNATINWLEGTLTTRLDAQDRRIETALKSRDPRPKPQPTEAKGAKGKAVVAATPIPPVPSTSGSKAMDETPARVARVDDPAEEPPIELTTEGAAATTPEVPAPTILKSGFQPSADKVVPLTTNAQGKPTPSANMPPSWATLTKNGIAQQQSTAAHANAVKQGMGRSSTGKARPETVARRTQSGNTEATIIRGLGLDNIAFELTIRKMSPANIVAETRGEIERLSGGKVILLSGRWSQHAKAHNFVYTFKGDLPFSALYPLRDVLTKPLHVGHLVPNDGWTYAQLRNVVTSNSDGVVPNLSQLETEIRRNPAFENAIFCIAPHWAGNLNNVTNKPRGTVNMAYVDEKGHLTGRARANGVFMYNERANYVVTGDTPTIILCGRCHRIGHATDSTACPLPANAVRCFICGGAHHSLDHATHCPNPHDKVGECKCWFRCINCGQNHNARSPHCRMKMGFSPPPLAARPSHSPSPAAPSAKGKAKQPASHPVESLVPSQREPAPTSADDADDSGFIEVSRGKHRRNRGKKAAVQAANASVPGASTASTGSKKITSPIPARPILKNWPTPPTGEEAPVINHSHVASSLDASNAIQRVLGKDAPVEKLCELEIMWGGDPDNMGEPTRFDSLHFRYAVKYGFPLTTAQTIRRIAGPDIVKGITNINEWVQEWGEITPFRYLLSTIPVEQTFDSTILDVDSPAANAMDAANNREMARIVIEATIKTQSFLQHLDPTYISANTVEQVLDEYNDEGTYRVFALTNTKVVWDTLAETQALYDQIHTPDHA